jgi:hypothetical protein
MSCVTEAEPMPVRESHPAEATFRLQKPERACYQDELVVSKPQLTQDHG